jgi:transposase InsO family protein
MTMDTDPPTLGDIGHVLWGANWRELLAEALGATKEEVTGWETTPASRPEDLQRTLENLGVVRLEEIGLMLVQMKENGLSDGSK